MGHEDLVTRETTTKLKQNETVIETIFQNPDIQTYLKIQYLKMQIFSMSFKSNIFYIVGF